MDNVLFQSAIELQADVLAKTKAKSEATTNLNNSAFVQMVMFIAGNVNNFDKAGNRRPEINGGTKLAGAFQVNLVENHQFTKRQAQTVASISFNKKLTGLIIRGLAGLDVPENNQELLQSVTNILSDNELTSVNKLKSYIEGPKDKVAKLLEAIAKLDDDELEDFKAGFEILTGEDE
tara:strand:- start:345 stop:875 length:531 start_codon:yes stop_codon:yes gene_type:complete